MRRREFIGELAMGALALSGLSLAGRARAATARRPNVLFICVDDLNDWVGVLGGHPQARTPHIDRLAAQGVLFANAHCDVPECRASRVATLTGRRPSDSGFHARVPIKTRMREKLPGVVTLPQTFTRSGYEVAGSGKIFHQPDPKSWPAFYPSRQVQLPPEPEPRTPLRRLSRGPQGFASALSWGAADVPESQLTDPQVVEWIDGQLGRAHERPFFLAAGLYRPHVPWRVPQAYFDLHPKESLVLPEYPADDLDDVPETVPRQIITWTFVREHGVERDIVQAYLAAISFADAMVGRMLDALARSAYASDTIVVLWSDNGLQMGDKGHVFKSRLWERSTRVPLIVVAPGVTKPGGVCRRPVNLVDVFPTLVELCGLDVAQPMSGESLVPWLRDPAAPRERPALTAGRPGDFAVRSERWRYIRYADGSEELYDHDADPNEWRNLAAQPELAGVKAELRRWMPES